METSLKTRIHELLKKKRFADATAQLINTDFSNRDNEWLMLTELMLSLSSIDSEDRDCLELGKKIFDAMQLESKTQSAEKKQQASTELIGAKRSWKNHEFTSQEAYEFSLLESIRDLDDSTVEEFETLISTLSLESLSPALQYQIYSRVYGL